jgi:hypothetical protein
LGACLAKSQLKLTRDVLYPNFDEIESKICSAI